MANDFGVGESNDETVFAGLVFVLVLTAKTTTLTVVGAAFATAPVFDLVPAEVSSVLCYEIECLYKDR